MATELLETLKEAIVACTTLSPITFFTLLATSVAVYYFVFFVVFRGSFHHHQQPEQHRLTTSSPSSSHSIPASVSQSKSWNFDVFMSFRGEDTRKNFVDHLYSALVQQGIHTYKDDETLARGESIGPALLKAIRESQIAIVVFSENYADSSWCLDELAHIIECMNTRGQIVMPVYYDVDPSDVRKQTGIYGEAFIKHEKGNYKHKVESWRNALVKASNLSGWVLKYFASGHEAKCIKDVVATVSGRVSPQLTNVNKELVGIETRLQDLKSMLKIGSGGVRMVGIWGVGGAGKTTLASAAYMEISNLFEACCLIDNVREESSKHGLKRLQEEILSGVLKSQYWVGSELEGRSKINKYLCHKKVLIVLDDVDDVKQLDALAGSHDWFGDGSRIIITTRDEHVLTSQTDAIYEVSLFSHDEAIKLFSRHAYRKDKPVEDYEMLSHDVVSYAGGLPLALEILGSFLRDKDKDEWMSALAKLKCIPNIKVMERLKISYDGLEYHEKELFLDMACFLRRWSIDRARRVLDACSFHPVIGVKVLVQKSLIKISNGKFDMHDLVEEMAHYIVRGEPPNHPEKQSRIWQEKDILELCAMRDQASMENNHIEVLALPSYISHPDLPRVGAIKAEEMRLHELVRSALPSYVSHPRLPYVVANMKKLRWLYWEGYPAFSLPSNFQPTKLGCLMLIRGLQTELWQGHKDLPNLKILDLRYSFDLMRTPDFSGLPCLEILILEDCIQLEEIHPSIGYHERLVLVNMKGCSKLKVFPPIIKMKKLETLELSSCRQLQKFPDIQTSMKSLANLHLDRTGIEIIPASVGQFCTNLVFFNISYCEKLQRIEGNFHLLRSLKVINLDGCVELRNFAWDLFDKDCCLGVFSLSLRGYTTSFMVLPQFPRFLRELNLSNRNLESIPSDICELVNLQVLDLSYNNFLRLPSSLSQIPCLKLLNLSACKSLAELPDLPSSIAVLEANWCDSLESVGDLSDYKWLWKVSLVRANKLIGRERVLPYMLQVNVVADRFMSVTLPSRVQRVSRSLDTRTFTVQLPHNWYYDFSGFLISSGPESFSIIFKQEIPIDCQLDHDHWEVFDKNWESYERRQVGYVPFSSLRHTPVWNSTDTYITFQSQVPANPKVGLVPRKNILGDSRETRIDCSECWDEEYIVKNVRNKKYTFAKTFEILDDSKSSSIQIVWNHRYFV